MNTADGNADRPGCAAPAPAARGRVKREAARVGGVFGEGRAADDATILCKRSDYLQSTLP